MEMGIACPLGVSVVDTLKGTSARICCQIWFVESTYRGMDLVVADDDALRRGAADMGRPPDRHGRVELAAHERLLEVREVPAAYVQGPLQPARLGPALGTEDLLHR